MNKKEKIMLLVVILIAVFIGGNLGLLSFGSSNVSPSITVTADAFTLDYVVTDACQRLREGSDIALKIPAYFDITDTDPSLAVPIISSGSIIGHNCKPPSYPASNRCVIGFGEMLNRYPLTDPESSTLCVELTGNTRIILQNFTPIRNFGSMENTGCSPPPIYDGKTCGIVTHFVGRPANYVFSEPVPQQEDQSVSKIVDEILTPPTQEKVIASSKTVLQRFIDWIKALLARFSL